MPESVEPSGRKKYGCGVRLAIAGALWEPLSLASNLFNAPVANYIYPNFVQPVVEGLMQILPCLPLHIIGYGTTYYLIGKAATLPIVIGAFIAGPETVAVAKRPFISVGKWLEPTLVGRTAIAVNETVFKPMDRVRHRITDPIIAPITGAVSRVATGVLSVGIERARQTAHFLDERRMAISRLFGDRN